MNRGLKSDATSVERHESPDRTGSDVSTVEADGFVQHLVNSLIGFIRRHKRVLIFPFVVLVLLLLLTVLGVSGSSTPLLSPAGGGGDSVVLGSPRSIRSDEWIVHTPFVISQVENDFPRFGDVGVGSHDMSILSDTPVLDWTAAFHPNLWGYFILPINNAHAFDWWSVAAVLLIGTYFFLFVVVGSVNWSVLGAVFLFGSPYFHWWYTSSVFTCLGWMGLAAACLIVAMKASGRRRIFLAVLSGYLLVCFALVIYPPWQISAALALAAITSGVLWTMWRQRLLSLQTVLTTIILAGISALFPLLVFYVTRRPAFQAIAQTVYPGERLVAGGDLPWTQLFSSWFGFRYVSDGAGMRGLLFPNESEASSFLFLGIGLLIALPLAWRFLFPIGNRFRGVAVATVGVMVLLLTQTLVGLPTIVAKLTLLSQVPERRSLVGLGFASVVLVVVIGSALEQRDIPRYARLFSGIALVAAMGAGVLGLAQAFGTVDAEIGRRAVVLALLMAVVPAALYFWKPKVSVGLLAVFGLLVSLSVNPVVRGLSQTRDSAFVREVHAISTGDDDGSAWIGETYLLASLLTTAGVRNLSGVNLYPNVPAWEILDPSRQYEEAWNRYAQAVWSFDPALRAPQVRLVQMDMVEVRVSPCDPVLDRFSVRRIATPRKLVVSCLAPPTETIGPEGETVYVYERKPVGSGPTDGWTVR